MTTRITTSILEPTIGQAISELVTTGLSSGVATYASSENFPLVGNSDGDLAYSLSDSILYVWANSEWKTVSSSSSSGSNSESLMYSIVFGG